MSSTEFTSEATASHTRHGGRRHAHLLVVPAAAVLLWAVRPGDGGTTLCPFALLTGTACPGCGLTRAGGALLRGDFSGAFAYHPLVFVVALWIAVAWGLAVARATGRDVHLGGRLVNGLLILTGVLFFVVWFVRMGTGTLPSV